MVALVLHLQAFDLLHAGSFGLFPAILVQVLLFGSVFLHISVSLSSALVTLGRLEDPEKKRKLDKVMMILCLSCFAVCLIVVAKTYVILAGMPA